MAESQSDHRQAMEKAVVDRGNKRADRGLVFGFILSLAVLGVGLTLILTGHGPFGIVMIVGQAVVLASLFIFGKIDQRRERESQRTQWVG